jgi:hypothetical protein
VQGYVVFMSRLAADHRPGGERRPWGILANLGWPPF